MASTNEQVIDYTYNDFNKIRKLFIEFRKQNLNNKPNEQHAWIKTMYDNDIIINLQKIYNYFIGLVRNSMYSEKCNINGETPYCALVGSDDGHDDAIKYLVTFGSVDIIDLFLNDPTNNICVNFIKDAITKYGDIEFYNIFCFMDDNGVYSRI